MNQLVTNSQLAQALGVSRQSIEKKSKDWRLHLLPGRGGKVKHYEIPSLPVDIQQRLLQHRLQKLTLSDLEPFLCESGGSASELHKVPEPALERALAKAKAVRLVEETKELNAVPHGQRQEHFQRWLDDFNRGLVDSELSAQVGPLSKRSLYRWCKVLKEKGVAGLVDHRGRHRRNAIEEDLKEFIETCLLGRPGITAAKIHRLMLHKFKGSRLPASGTVRNLVAKMRQERQARLSLLHHPSLFKRQYQPSLGRADAGLTEPNQRWEADSTRADLMTADGRRCTLIAVVDVWTRRPVFGVVERGGGYPIAQTFFKAFKQMGIPREVIVDLGKDYQSKQVQALFMDLGIKAPRIPGYSPELKPHAEIAFHLVSDLLRTLTGYTGNRLSKRPEVIQTKFTLNELQDLVDKWVQDFESHHVVSTIGCTPRERWEKAIDEGWRPKVAPLDQLFLLLKPAEPRSVAQGRIHYNRGLYTAAELLYLEPSDRVWVRPDPEDADMVYVFDQVGEFICIATDLDRLNLTPKQIRERKKRWWSIRRLERKASRERVRALDLDDLERARLDEVAAKTRPLEALPASNLDLPALKAAAQARQEMLGQAEPGDDHSLDQGEGQVLDPWGQEIDIQHRPVFLRPSERAVWILVRQREGLANSPADLVFLEKFKTSPMWRQLGGDQFEEFVLGLRNCVVYDEVES
ncbi:MAG: DDE-type integrase/transposase/recombinase [Deltaproteobacteria bacterium]|nr:DDE-type integrase/transposase/recombinase [Deltaproteobacteria bacterium]